MGLKKKISESFWVDSLNGNRYAKRELISESIPESRLQYWDSNLEHSCYYRLLKLSQGSEIIRQSEKVILPQKHPFQQLSWKIDFEVKGARNYLVECKGEWIKHNGEALANFLKLLRFFQMFYPFDFERLIIVSNKKFRLGNAKIMVYDFDDLPELIK